MISLYKQLIFLLLLLPASVSGAYLKNQPVDLTQPDGTVIHCFATGDEYYHWVHDARNYTIITDPQTGYYVYANLVNGELIPTLLVAGRDDPAAGGLKPGLNFPTATILPRYRTKFHTPSLKSTTSTENTGTLNNIVIFVRFSDQTEYTQQTAYYDQAFNQSGTVSLYQYYQEVSQNRLNITTRFYPVPGSTVLSYQDAQPRNYYRPYNAATNTIGYHTDNESTEREMTLLKNAVESVNAVIDAAGFDYDFNTDGKVDNITFIVQGNTDGWSDLLWPHKWSLYYYSVYIGNLRVYDYNFQLSNVFGVSVLCHEMFHTLGAPDLYHYSNDSFTPVGPWDLMASNRTPPQHMGAYMKKKYGGWFNQLTPITTDGTYTLEPLSTNPYAAYKISSPNSNSEFFIVEYRKQTGLFESSLPSSGLLIYRINESIGGNANGPPDEVYIYRPGGTTTSNGNIWNATFSAGSGRTSFGVSTDPSCFLSDGSPGGIQITNVSSTGTTISFNLSFNNASTFNPPRNLTAQVNLNNVSLQWDTPENGTPTLSGYHLYRDGTLIHTISNPATLTYNDNNLSPGSYTYHATAYYISPTGESDPSNQATVFIQTLLPDLVITSSSIQPNIVLAGETVSWSMICKNTGTAVTGSFDNRVYLSKDQNRDAGDLLLGSVNYSNLAVNATQTWNGQALVPAGSDEGSWYILMCTDGNSEVVESDEGNNNQTHPITIKESYPDLNVFDISIPQQNIQDGKPVEFHFNISNIGTLSAGYFEVFVYLSDDALPDASDYVLASVGVNGLNPSGHLSFEYNPVIPKGTTAGDYYLIIVADTGEVTGDKNTDNNKAFRMFTVFQLPDLTVSATLDQDEYRPGSTVHLQWNTENLDSGPADHYMLLVLLSPTLDNTFDDVAIYFENGPLIYGGGSVTLDLPVTLDQDQPPGTYYLMIVADPDNTLPESSESNNSVTKSFNVMDISSSGHFNPENTILLYPNPVRRILHIQTGDLFKQGSYTVQIFNREGLKHYKKVLHKAPESILSVPVDFLIPGSYYLVIQQGTVTRTMPFIKLK